MTVMERISPARSASPCLGASGVLSVQQSVQTVKLGVSFHMWAGM
jgi:hypothetical protein